MLIRAASSYGVTIEAGAATYLRRVSREVGDGDLRPYLPREVCRILHSVCQYNSSELVLNRTNIDRVASVYFTKANHMKGTLGGMSMPGAAGSVPTSPSRRRPRCHDRTGLEHRAHASTCCDRPTDADSSRAPDNLRPWTATTTGVRGRGRARSGGRRRGLPRRRPPTDPRAVAPDVPCRGRRWRLVAAGRRLGLSWDELGLRPAHGRRGPHRIQARRGARGRAPGRQYPAVGRGRRWPIRVPATCPGRDRPAGPVRHPDRHRRLRRGRLPGACCSALLRRHLDDRPAVAACRRCCSARGTSFRPWPTVDTTRPRPTVRPSSP